MDQPLLIIRKSETAAPAREMAILTADCSTASHSWKYWFSGSE
jgi:hypothetical protein